MAKKKKKNAKKLVLGVLIAYVAIMALGYMGVSYYFSSHFLKGTTISGMDSSNKTADQVKKKIQKQLGQYKLRITEIDGKTETIQGSAIDLTYVDDGKIDELLSSQDRWKWITAFSAKKTYELAVTTTYDEKKLTGVLDDMSCFQQENIVAPEDAYLEEQDGEYVIVPEVEGNTLDRTKLESAVKDAIENGKTEINLEELGCYEKPSVLQDDAGLIAERDAKNQLLKVDITYDFGDRSETVDGSVVKDWLIQDSDGNWTVDESKAAAYVQQLAYKYDTFGLTHEFTTHAGNKITLKGGDYGWVIKKSETTAALVEYIKEGKTGTVEPVYLYEGKSRDTNDIGGTYVEISIQDQEMWCYKDGVVVVDTPVVTGNVSKGYDTPAGSVWAIDAKKHDAVLKGEGYTQPVTYWMPFNGNVGIHDADTWRSQYGGEIYKTSGSHGCVNIPTANAEKIFNTVEIGTPVIVY